MTSLNLFHQLPLTVLDDSRKSPTVESALSSSQSILELVNNDPNHVFLHFWPLENTVILGMIDRQLPSFENAKKYLEDQGYQVAIRNIGGLAVVSDSGVLNFSLCLPIGQNDDSSFRIADGYLIMVDLIKEALKSSGKVIDVEEISQSYCPGKYDLSIDGKKFAGIAQRRKKNAVLISIYLSVSGDQEERCRLLSHFYKEGKSQESRIAFPNINSQCMANLSDLLETPLTVDQLIEMIKVALSQNCFQIKQL
ncbi:lipoate--protein ligase family protein [Streptococcus pseudoporcinus]|uniref:Biotin/lipoate A/B protein ligase family protein n=1 Tax=Streptococcus pseudoporcinus LQ 940-04 TaxID=875093 RepID=G5KBY2_9STRE|nr:lipoate--protein ligase family protein [Streptococcus pseudoporcinus]EFR44304.1 biotin/lipoate A/B protein ligase family protein [Streptococcus pseudoporcinus SPIN 20026]EHI64457.1 biotin/lipoate A/B protein ligase family protein [Streptococcus pseudoporcinus LQ 940-04]VEF92979.1 lipoate-protein ligase A [Streptococcus pseudoporcinus]